jgi:Flp pilus assembly protein TadG
MKKSQKIVLRSGVAAIEFALVAPVFFLLMFSLIEFGRMMMVQQSLTNAAREGCRTAALATTNNSSDVESAVRNYLQSVISNAADVDEVHVTVPASLASVASGTDLTVTVDVEYSDVSWLPLGYLGIHPKIVAAQTGQRE